ncbi:hypothetical protein NHX12_013852 [Muraenolepis orangiensis]|uniref:Immunoglobulin domain-containing protein n=1 Tax=Muraenolepis orangiensis TaxID=630683 RepID=A0A9Q0DC26_9TELE|nr:hypothetical protein NHX12_013591 [Muraenolepis orangiensis]KAJ3585130.1 hypothetical protein NHX12_013852 [Muraenolepis orangiensis]
MEREEEALEATPDTEPKDDQEITVSVEEEEATGGETVDNVEFEEAIEEGETSPVHPVLEGASVTLRCLEFRNQMSALTPVNQSSTFYRDGRVIGVSWTGEMSVAALNRSDEGVYTCSISGVDSPESWLAVKGALCHIKGELL